MVTTMPVPVGPDLQAARLSRAQDELQRRSLDALLIGPSADYRYLTGYEAPTLERLTLLVVPADGEVTLVVPELEAPLADEYLGVEVALESWSETEDPVALVASILGARCAGRLAVGDRLWSTFLLALQGALPKARWDRASTVMRELRVKKDQAEVEALAAVGAAIDGVVDGLQGMRWAGRTELDVAHELDAAILEGHDASSFVIVGSGANSASPHHVPGSRRIASGDAIVIDIGGVLAGYCSDTTRTLVVGDVPHGFARLYEILRAAQEAGCAAVRPGITAAQVDAVCREIITDGGYGDRFIHRTGHGIGLDEHEDPFIVAGNDAELEPGMAFSIEPGIYLEGRYGARIEDIVVCTSDGGRLLNNTSRELLVVPD